MFIFSKKKKAKQSLLDVVGKLQETSNRYKGLGLDALIRKIQLDTDYHPNWKDLDGVITKLISMLRYNLNDGNTKTVQTLLGYIGKLVDSRIGFSNYYEQLKSPKRKQLQELDISMNEYLDKADHAQANLEKEPHKHEFYAFEYRSAIIESKQIANLMLEILTSLDDSDLERKKQIAQTQERSEDIAEKINLFAFYDDKINHTAKTNVELNKNRYSGLDDIELPSPKVPPKTSPKATEADAETKRNKKIMIEE